MCYPRKVNSMILLLSLAQLVAADDLQFKIIKALPKQRAQIASEAQKQAFSGKGPDLLDAAVFERTKLLTLLLKLETESKGEPKASIERDLEAIARDARIRGHQDGWGGTAVSLDEANAVVAHLVARISYRVWMLTKDNPDFDFDSWRKEWTGQSKKNP